MDQELERGRKVRKRSKLGTILISIAFINIMIVSTGFEQSMRWIIFQSSKLAGLTFILYVIGRLITIKMSTKAQANAKIIVGIIAIINSADIVTDETQIQNEEYQFIQSIARESSKNKNGEQSELYISRKDYEKHAIILRDKMKEIVQPYSERKIKIFHDISRIIESMSQDYTDIFLDKNKFNSHKKDAEKMLVLLDELQLLQTTIKKTITDWTETMPKRLKASSSKYFEQGYEQFYPLFQEQVSLLRGLSEDYNAAIQLAEKPRGKITLSNGALEFGNEHDLEIYNKTSDKISKTIQEIVKIEERQNEKLSEVRNLK